MHYTASTHASIKKYFVLFPQYFSSSLCYGNLRKQENQETKVKARKHLSF